MNFANSVYELSETFMADPSLVLILDDNIEDLAEQMRDGGPPSFPVPEVKDIQKGILLELVAASVNYCYWYGKSTVRPLHSNSTKMYDLLLQAFENYTSWHNHGNTSNRFEDCIKRFQMLLSINRFPLIEERIKHLDELVKEDGEQFSVRMLRKQNELNINDSMFELISLYPGFASDLFLKRASLFYIQLFRRFGWFADDLKQLHVPADYQVPKMLEHFGCISYDFALLDAIENGELIPKGSIAECEIRSATVLTIKKLCELTGWNVAEVDGYFFLQRNEATNPFHLTITTDY